MPADPLTQVLSALRITTTLFAIADLSPTWGVGFPQASGAYFHVLEGDDGWLEVPGSPARRVSSGEVVLLTHGSAHSLTSERGGPASARFDPLRWAANAVATDAGSGTTPASRATLVCGSVDVANPTAHPLLALLPDVVQVSRDDAGAADLELTLRLLQRETRSHGPGSQTLLARLGDVLLVQLIRIWATRLDTAPTGWLVALYDPALGPALTAFHSDPAASWTVQSLADRAHLSRSRFAERFTAATGQTPLAYVTAWRLTIAEDHLRHGDTVAAAAHAAGYASETAFSRAFSRHHGHPPSAIRRGP